MFSIVNGARPPRPDNSATIGLSDSLWELLQDCWNGDRSRRPQMQDVEVQIGDVAAKMSHHRLAPLSRRSWESPSNPGATSSNCNSTETRNSSVSDLLRPSVPEIRIDAVGPEESGPSRMQEFYPIPSPISPHPGSQSNETLINRLDGASD